MNERWWVPVLAAVVGLFGGMGGAYIGGAVANEGQQQRFENEQAVRVQNLQRDAYADLRTVASVNSGASRSFGNVDFAEGKVELYGRPEVRKAAYALAYAVENHKQAQDYLGPRDRFIEAAKAELLAGK